MSDSDNFANRRGFLFGAMKVVPAAALLTGSQTVMAAPPAGAEPYKPNYFDESEWRFITTAVDRLIPSNENGPVPILGEKA